MSKLKLSIWCKFDSVPPTFCGVAYDLKSYAAIAEAIKAGCFGPASRTKFYTEFHDGKRLRKEVMFSKVKGRLVLFLPTDVAMNWHSTVVDRTRATQLRVNTKVKWELLPWSFNIDYLAEPVQNTVQ